MDAVETVAMVSGDEVTLKAFGVLVEYPRPFRIAFRRNFDRAVVPAYDRDHRSKNGLFDCL